MMQGAPAEIDFRSRSGGGGGGSGSAFVKVRRPGNGSEIFIPNNGPVAMVAGIPFGTFPAWTNLAAPPNDYFITRLQARRTLPYGALTNVLVEWAYGAGPTAIDAVRIGGNIIDPTGDDVGSPWGDLNEFNTRVPAGQTLQARVTEGAAGTWQIWTAGWDTVVPTFTSLNVHAATGIGRYYPSNVSTGFNVVGALWPAYGAWLLVVDPAPNDMLVMGLIPATSGANQTMTGTAYQIGIGAAGAEVDCGTFLSGHAQGTINCDPAVWVKAGERLSIRCSTAGAASRPVVIKVVDL